MSGCHWFNHCVAVNPREILANRSPDDSVYAESQRASFNICHVSSRLAWRVALLTLHQRAPCWAEAGLLFRSALPKKQAGIWVEFHSAGAKLSADGVRQTRDVVLIRSRGAAGEGESHTSRRPTLSFSRRGSTLCIIRFFWYYFT